MRQRFFIILLFAVSTAVTASAASDEACTRETLRPLGARAHIDVAPLFEKNEAGEVPPEGMEVLVARIAPDGSPVLACVDSAEAAKKFFEAPMEKVARGAKEK